MAVSVSVAINVVSGAPTNADLAISFNLLPVVSKLSASLSRLDAGQSTTVSATASDADGDALSYQWTSNAACPGTWTNTTSSSASFVPSSVPAGACNNCQLTVTVKDGRGGQTTGSLNLCVATASTTRFPPRFTNFQPSASSISPRQSVTFDVTAIDPQSSSLTFAWSLNAGSLASVQNTATTSHAVWTAPSCTVAGVTPTVTATVTNAYGLSASLPFPLSGLPACTTGWAAAGTMSAGRRYPTATLLSSGKVLVTGGTNGSVLSSTELYNPATNSWASAAPMASVRYAHTATLLPSGKVLITGGSNGSSALASTEVCDPATSSWASAAPMKSSRSSHMALLLNSGKVLVLGGSSGSTTLAQAEVYDPATNAWASVTPMSAARVDFTATLLSSGKVLVTGGQNASGQVSSVEVYDPATNAWAAAANTLSTELSLHTATLLPSGKVFIAGGYYIIPRPYAQLYDPATNSVSPATPTTWIAANRDAHTATLLNSGKVLLAGGDTNSGITTSAELYDPATRSSSTVGSMALSRANHTATLLPSGQVLISGGYNGGYPSSAELYTP